MSEKYIIGKFDEQRGAYPTFAAKDFECLRGEVKSGYQGPYITESALLAGALKQDDTVWGDPNSTIDGATSKLEGNIYLKDVTIKDSQIKGSAVLSDSRIVKSNIETRDDDTVFAIRDSEINESNLKGVYKIHDSDLSVCNSDANNLLIENSNLFEQTLEGDITIWDSDISDSGRIKNSKIDSCNLRYPDFNNVNIEMINDQVFTDYDKLKTRHIEGTEDKPKNISGIGRYVLFKLESESTPVQFAEKSMGADYLKNSSTPNFDRPETATEGKTTITDDLMDRLNKITANMKSENSEMESDLSNTNDGPDFD